MSNKKTDYSEGGIFCSIKRPIKAVKSKNKMNNTEDIELKSQKNGETNKSKGKGRAEISNTPYFLIFILLFYILMGVVIGIIVLLEKLDTENVRTELIREYANDGNYNEITVYVDNAIEIYKAESCVGNGKCVRRFALQMAKCYLADKYGKLYEVENYDLYDPNTKGKYTLSPHYHCNHCLEEKIYHEQRRFNYDQCIKNVRKEQEVVEQKRLKRFNQFEARERVKKELKKLEK